MAETTEGRWTAIRNRLKRVCRISAVSVRTVLLVLLLVLVAAELWCELIGLPASVLETVRAGLANRGVNCEFGRVRAGIFRGLTVDDTRITLDTGYWPIDMQCRRVRARLNVPELLRGRLEVDSVTFSAGTLELVDTEKRAVGEPPLPAVREMNGSVIQEEEGTYSLRIEGEGQSVSVLINGKLRNVAPLVLRGKPDSTQDAPVARSIPEAERNRGRELVRLISAKLAEYRFTNRDASVELIVDTDLRDPALSTVRGNFSFSDLRIRDVPVRKARGTITWAGDSLTLEEGEILLKGDEGLVGSASFDLAGKTVAATVEGRIMPRTLLHFTGIGVPNALNALRLTSPLTINAELAPSPVGTWREWVLDATLSARQFVYGELPVQSADLDIRVEQGVINVLRLALDPAGGKQSEELFLEGRVLPEAGRFEGRGRLVADTLLRLDQMGIDAARRARNSASGVTLNPLVVLFEVESLPFDAPWNTKGGGTFELEKASFLGYKSRSLAGTFSLADGELQIRDASLRWQGEDRPLVRGSLEVDVAGLREKDLLEITAAVVLPEQVAGDGVGAGATDLLKVAGRLQIHPKGEKISLDLEGTCFPDRAYEALRTRLQLPEIEPVARIACLDEPARFRIGLPLSPFRPREWVFTGHAEADNARYGDLAFRTCSGDVSLSSRSIRITNIRGTLGDGVEVAVDVSIDLAPLAVEVSNVTVRGRPEFAVAFVPSGTPAEIYSSVWKDFRWADGSPPLLTLRSLKYSSGLRSEDWRLTMSARVEAENAEYRGLPIRRLGMDVILDLPGSVRIENVVVERDNVTAKGNVLIRTGDNPSCTFALKEMEGGCDPREIVAMINPAWADMFGPVRFSPASVVTCSGSFSFSEAPELRLEGVVRAPFCMFRDARIEEVEGVWRFDSGGVAWDVPKARLYGGTIRSTGMYAGSTRHGIIAVKANRVELHDFLAAIGDESVPNELAGVLSGDVVVRLLKSWTGDPLQLSGTGRLRISEADLWKVPVLGRLGVLLNRSLVQRFLGGGVGGLGKITLLDADLVFAGDRLLVNRFATDGTVLSLKGEGEYSLASSRIHFSVMGETFREVGVLSWAFKPLSWLFTAELTGPVKSPKWSMNTALKRAFGFGPKSVEVYEDKEE